MIKRHRRASSYMLRVLIVGALSLFLLQTQVWAASPVRDRDNDTYFSDVDCDDRNAAINPGAAEVCNDGDDNDCDGLIDEADNDCGLACTDSDGDGYSAASGCQTLVDCNDDPDQGGASIYPGAGEICGDGIDNDCDNEVDLADSDCPSCTDSDGDLYYAGTGCGSPDCDDDNSAINPLASEDCADTVDNNCDGNVNEGCPPGDVDSDHDLFSNDQENNGITLSPELLLWGSGNEIPGYSVGCTFCMNPNIPTLFIILRLANPSNVVEDASHYIEDYFEFLTHPDYNLGYNVFVLREDSPTTTRIISPGAEARGVLLIEDLDTGGIKWGISQYNTLQVQGKGIARFYSQRVVNANYADCLQNTSSNFKCQDVPSLSLYETGELTFHELSWVMSHEPLHVLGGVIGGDHHDLAPDNILEPAVTVTIKGGKVKYFTPTAVADTTIQELSFD